MEVEDLFGRGGGGTLPNGVTGWRKTSISRSPSDRCRSRVTTVFRPPRPPCQCPVELGEVGRRPDDDLDPGGHPGRSRAC